MVQTLKNIAYLLIGFAIFWFLLRFDMSTGGRVAAKSIHHSFPDCSNNCHKT
jgi:hypothetical protein